MTRVVAPSRLHFGLLHVPADPASPAPRFGGCGLMIDRPGVAVRVEPAASWSGDGPSADRAVGFARRVTDTPHRVVVERCPPEHVGLGVGTALGLAVAKAVRPELAAPELAALVGRGERSGVGLYGFDRGGFVVDAGKRPGDTLPSLVGHYPFPDRWRVVLIVPDAPAKWHGDAERAAFSRERDPAEAGRVADRMGRLLAGEVVPALEAADFDRFAAAVGEYNRLAGQPFAADQGGTYAGPAVSTVVDAVRGLGVAGVGQSSWGPAVFALAPDADAAEHVAAFVRGRFAGLRALEVTGAATTGATVEVR